MAEMAVTRAIGRRTFDLRWRGWFNLHIARVTNQTWLAWESCTQIGPLAWITWKRQGNVDG